MRSSIGSFQPNMIIIFIIIDTLPLDLFIDLHITLGNNSQKYL